MSNNILDSYEHWQARVIISWAPTANGPESLRRLKEVVAALGTQDLTLGRDDAGEKIHKPASGFNQPRPHLTICKPPLAPTNPPLCKFGPRARRDPVYFIRRNPINTSFIWIIRDVTTYETVVGRPGYHCTCLAATHWQARRCGVADANLDA